MTKCISGIPVSDGVAMGKVLLLKKAERAASTVKIAEDETEKEIQRFKEAVGRVIGQTKELYESAKVKLGEEEAEIFAAHLSVAEDPMIDEGVCEKIRESGMNSELALEQTLSEISQLFDSMEDEYLKERAADVKDVGGRIMDSLKGNTAADLSSLPYPCIIVAEDLTPSETVGLDQENTVGFITGAGGRTSHTAIISRSLEIPAVVGIGTIPSEMKDGGFVILDALKGDVIIDPDDETINEYKSKQEEFRKEKKALLKLKELPAETSDGHAVELCANIGNPLDAKNVLQYGAEGIGLYRTEFLYMENTHFPTEEEQFGAYKAVAEIMGNKPVIIRTLDIGGDKELPYFDFEPEENPFLGWRAIRFCLDRTDVFRTQLRAILRASAYGNLKIMYPMIISKEEILRANEILEMCKEELRSEGVSFDKAIKTGIMVETPAAVAVADVLAKYADFFSIGTNDLCQYTLAVDRGNTKIRDKYDPFHPAVLRNIKRVIDAAHKEGKPVGMCGEFAGDERAAKILAGFGLDEFSMTASGIPKVKKMIRELSLADAESLAADVLKAESVEEVMCCVNGN